MAKTKATHHVVFIAANIHGPGLVDCLRYDNCCPASEAESYKLERALHQQGAHWIIFRRFVAVGAPSEPVVARWKSFGIECLPTAFSTYYEAESAILKMARTVTQKETRA